MVLAALATLTASASAGEVPMTLRNANVVPLAFADMQGWAQANPLSAFQSFMKRCGAILQGSRAMRRKRPRFGGLFCAGEVAKMIEPPTEGAARHLFESSFRPMRGAKAGDVN